MSLRGPVGRRLTLFFPERTGTRSFLPSCMKLAEQKRILECSMRLDKQEEEGEQIDIETVESIFEATAKLGTPRVLARGITALQKLYDVQPTNRMRTAVYLAHVRKGDVSAVQLRFETYKEGRKANLGKCHTILDYMHLLTTVTMLRAKFVCTMFSGEIEPCAQVFLKKVERNNLLRF